MHDTVVVYLLKHFLVGEINVEKEKERKPQPQEGRRNKGKGTGERKIKKG